MSTVVMLVIIWAALAIALCLLIGCSLIDFFYPDDWM